MLKHLTAAVAITVVVGAAVVGATRAQEPPAPTMVTATVSATPAQAGTARRPRGLELNGKIDVIVPEGQARPVVTGFELWTGPGLVFDRTGVPACSAATLRHGGPSRCPPTSIVGTGSLDDTTLPTDFGQGNNIVFLNAPGGTMAAWIVLQNPARVQAATFSTVVDGARGRWPHRDAFRIPPSLQLVAGLPITIGELTFRIGGKAWAKDYIASTRCPAGGWTWKARVHTREAAGAAAVIDAHGHTPCHR
jgi:hypothetical protein